jgi:hypothetical protein
MDKAAVDAAIAALESSIHGIDFWALICGIFVAVFLAGEIWFIGAHWLKESQLKPLRERQAQLGEIELARLKTETANANTHAAQLALDLEKERQKTSPRPWTKEQFDAIQSMKGQIPAVAVIGQKDCVECILLANHLVTAFHDAGAEIFGDNTLELARATGIMVFLPPGSGKMAENLVVVALRKAGLEPSTIRMDERYAVQYGMRIDVPIIQVGERFPQYVQFPYFPPGGGSYSVHPLRN